MLLLNGVENIVAKGEIAHYDKVSINLVSMVHISIHNN